MNDHEKRAEAHRIMSVRRRILVGYIGLYPTLLLVLTILAPITKELSFPVAGCSFTAQKIDMLARYS